MTMTQTFPAERIQRRYAPSLFRLLSIDVALAGLGGGVMAVRIVNVSARPAFYLLLPLSVWVVYTLDHLLDAGRFGPSAKTPRHRFHFRHAALLWPMLAVAAILCAVLGITELSWTGVIFGLAVISLCCLHELIIKLAGARASPLLAKEIGVAIIFTAGTWGLPITLRLSRPGPKWDWPISLLLQYLLLAIVNLIEFSMFEAKIDAQHGQTSFVCGVGRRNAGRIATISLAAQFPIALLALYFYRSSTVWTAEIIYAAMSVGLVAILLFPRRFARREQYRVIGDGVFLLPLLIVICK
jgi:hypothetical protein